MTRIVLAFMFSPLMAISLYAVWLYFDISSYHTYKSMLRIYIAFGYATEILFGLPVFIALWSLKKFNPLLFVLLGYMSSALMAILFMHLANGNQGANITACLLAKENIVGALGGFSFWLLSCYKNEYITKNEAAA